MKLISLTLENIKSYVQETIPFYEGVNFISGVNGAGKSTIIEAVGYALFDSNPFSNLRQFVREGEKKGTISLVVEADDERFYRIVRRIRIPSGGSWTIYDLETEAEIDSLHGNQDVKVWLAENLGLNKGLDPSLLFEDVIGVSQGKFTQPFLERAKERKRIFNTILQLETYRQAFEKTAGLTSLLDKSILTKESEEKNLLVRVEDLPYCREQLLGNLTRVQELKGKLEILTAALKDLERKITEQEKLKESLLSTEKAIQENKIYLKSLREQKQRIMKDLEIALGCEQKVIEAKEGYLRYLQYQDLQKQLEVKRKSKEDMGKKEQVIQNQIIALKTEIASKKDTRKHQLEEGEKELTEIKTEGEKTALQKKQALERKSKYESWQNELEEIKERGTLLDKILDKYQQGHGTFLALLENHRYFKNEENKLDKALSLWAEIEKEALNVPVLENKLHILEEKLYQYRSKAATLEENCKATQGGLCPFLKVPCQNIEGGNLELHFNKELKKVYPQLKKVTEEKEQLEIQVKSSKKAQEKYLGLKLQKEQQQEVKVKIKEIEIKLEQEKQKFQEVLEPSFIKILQENAQKIELIFKKINSENKDMAVERDISLVIAVFGQATEKYCSSYQAIFMANKQTIAPEDNNYKILINRLEEVKNALDNLEKAGDAGFNVLLQIWGAHIASLDAKLLSLRENYKKIKMNLQIIEDDKTLEKKEKELAQNEQELKRLSDKLQEYRDLDQDWEENKKLLTKNEACYVQYMQNKDGADKKATLAGELKELENLEGLRLGKIQELEKLFTNLQENYDAELLLKIQKKRDEVVQEKGRSEEDFKRSTQEAERYKTLVAEKEKIQLQINDIKKEIIKTQKARKLLDIVRSTLNKSGEKMAEVYRQYLGREADLLYHQIAKENVHLLWADDYEVKIIDNVRGQERERTFTQLSGGEKMTAALAIRLALLKHLSGLSIGIFDEPTANLDDKRRNNLAQLIPAVTKEFRQILVISHDDTFDAITDNIIMLSKDSANGTRINNEQVS